MSVLTFVNFHGSVNQIIIKNELASWFPCHFLLGSGVLSMTMSSGSCPFRTFPFLDALALVDATYNDSMLWENCSAVGLSQLPPADRCLLKYSSKGSWLSFSLSRYFTPEVSRTLASSTNECTGKFGKTRTDTTYNLHTEIVNHDPLHKKMKLLKTSCFGDGL